MGRVLGPTSELLVVGGSNRLLPHLHEGEGANIEVGRAQDPLQKCLLHVDSDSIHGILLQTLMALLVIEEQVSSTRAIYLYMFQLPKNWITLEYVHDHPCIPREHGGGVNQGDQPSSLPTSGHILPLRSSPSLPRCLPMCCTAPAGKSMGSHPMACIPLGHLGNTSLQNLCACWDPSQLYNS